MEPGLAEPAVQPVNIIVIMILMMMTMMISRSSSSSSSSSSTTTTTTTTTSISNHIITTSITVCISVIISMTNCYYSYDHDCYHNQVPAGLAGLAQRPGTTPPTMEPLGYLCYWYYCCSCYDCYYDWCCYYCDYDY